MTDMATDLTRTVRVEDHADHLALWIEWTDAAGVVVQHESYPLQKTVGDVLETIHGPIAADRLERVITIEDGPQEVCVKVTWRQIVKQDVHLVLKQPSAIAGAIAGGF